MKTLIVIPTYNEARNIPSLLPQILNYVPKAHILVVDDHSPDGTGDLVDSYISENRFNKQLFILHREKKEGLGKAYIAGFQWGLDRGYDLFVSMDADFSHDPKYLPALLKEMQTNDLVIGSRYISGGGVVNWSLLRKIISRGGSLYARILLLSNIHDLTGGFNLYKAENLKKIQLNHILSNGYCFQIEMKFRHQLLNLKIKESPIIFHDRTLGQSKMSKNIFKEAILKTALLGISRFRLKRHLSTVEKSKPALSSE